MTTNAWKLIHRIPVLWMSQKAHSENSFISYRSKNFVNFEAAIAVKPARRTSGMSQNMWCKWVVALKHRIMKSWSSKLSNAKKPWLIRRASLRNLLLTKPRVDASYGFPFLEETVALKVNMGGDHWRIFVGEWIFQAVPKMQSSSGFLLPADVAFCFPTIL